MLNPSSLNYADYKNKNDIIKLRNIKNKNKIVIVLVIWWLHVHTEQGNNSAAFLKRTVTCIPISG